MQIIFARFLYFNICLLFSNFILYCKWNVYVDRLSHKLLPNAKYNTCFVILSTRNNSQYPFVLVTATDIVNSDL